MITKCRKHLFLVWIVWSLSWMLKYNGKRINHLCSSSLPFFHCSACMHKRPFANALIYFRFVFSIICTNCVDRKHSFMLRITTNGVQHENATDNKIEIKILTTFLCMIKSDSRRFFLQRICYAWACYKRFWEKYLQIETKRRAPKSRCCLTSSFFAFSLQLLKRQLYKCSFLAR